MLFNSVTFLVFFAVVYVLYRALPFKAQNRMLLMAGCIFYGAWDIRFLLLLWFSTLLDYFVGIGIEKVETPASKKKILLVSLATNLLILGIFKYFNFFISSATEGLNALGITTNPLLLNVVLPVGLSFYTFQSMSYTIDVYRGEVKACRRFWDFALFVAFFPQLVAGPISRAHDLLPQVLHPRRITSQHIGEGLWLCLWGFFQKIVIADNAARLVEPLFGTPGPQNGPQALLGVYAFALQIYGDFAGYSAIARGLARLLGFDLMNNFLSPYFSRNPAEFWRRWHISLSTWLRDYLYIPLGGNRKGEKATYRNLMMTMVLGGLWHGASWPFVLWGFYHGLILILHRVSLPLFRRVFGAPAAQKSPSAPNESLSMPRRRQISEGLKTAISVAVMFHLTCLGWLFFRAESLGQVSGFLGHLSSGFTLERNAGLSGFLALAALALPSAFLDFHAWKANSPTFVVAWSTPMRVLLFGAMLLSIVVFGDFGYHEFIYFQF